MTDQNTVLRAMDRRIRNSMVYSEWVKRNKGPRCLKCDTSENLECHHMIDLFHVILGVWKHYGEPEATIQHILMYHETDILEGLTLCVECHKKRHPGRLLTTEMSKVNSDTWCALPRNLKVDPNHSTSTPRKGSISLIAYQSLLGIGWHILNGHVESRILTIHRRRFASLLDKRPGASFNRSLDMALNQLQAIGILSAHHRRGNDVELHLEQTYLNMLGENPWFVPLSEIKTDSMCVLCLRLWLGMQTCRHLYCISLDKLQRHIGMKIRHRSLAIKAIRKALKHIPWANIADKESLQFTLGSRQPTPIRALRAILTDSLEQAK